MNEPTTKKARRTVFTWAAEHGYEPFLRHLSKAERDQIVPALIAADEAVVMLDRKRRHEEDAVKCGVAADKLREVASNLAAVTAKLDRIKSAAS